MPMSHSQGARFIDRFRVQRALPLLLVSLYAFCDARAAQQPAASQLPVNPPSSAGAYGSSTSGTPTPKRAEIKYDGAMLTVAASDSSLNQILREIARQTGMKVTGGVTDDRVFGTYGPASPSAVLASLLEGTSSNMLIVQDASHKPTELVLSPRVGRITPPNPNAAGFEDSDNASEAPPQPVRSVLPSPVPSSPNSRAPYRAGTGGIDTNPAATAPSSTSQQLAFPPVDATHPPSTATTTPNSADPTPDAVRTPQQIFEQLQRLRQQQTQPTKPQ